MDATATHSRRIHWTMYGLSRRSTLGQYSPQKLPGPRLRRIGEDRARVPFLHDCAIAHHHKMVTDVARKLHFMRDDDHRHAFIRQISHDLKDFEFDGCTVFHRILNCFSLRVLDAGPAGGRYLRT
jgi:hypothetical protein